jgi:uncharacterized BrkB/YihY/UPF0761 family membrane protein
MYDDRGQKALRYFSALRRVAIVRAYLGKRVWLLVALCVLLVLLLLVIMLAAVSLIIQQFPGPSPSLLRLGLFLLASTAWVVTSTGALYVLYSWLEKRAIARERCSALVLPVPAAYAPRPGGAPPVKTPAGTPQRSDD